MRDVPIKNPGDQYTSEEFNQLPLQELKNAVTDTGITLSTSDFHQLSKSISNYVAGGDYYTDSGVSNAYVLNVIGSKRAPTIYFDGLRVRFRVGNTNTGASTVNVNGLGVTSIKKYGGGADVEPGDLVANTIVELTYIDSLAVFELISVESQIIRESSPLFKNISGLTISNNGSDPINDIDIAPGTFKDTTTLNAATLASILTKRIDANWAASTNQGGFPSGLSLTADTWYHVFAISKADGTVDGGFDSDINASNLLADATGYVWYRRIGSVKYITGTPNTILPFTQINNKFILGIPLLDINITNPPTTQTFATLTVPPDVYVEAHIAAISTDDSTVGGNPFTVCSPAISDYPLITPAFNAKGMSGLSSTITRDRSFVDYIMTNTNSQVWYKFAFSSGGAHGFLISTHGWTELFD